MNEFKLPELGENISQGTVTKVLIKAKDTVTKGQNVLELETDKAVLEVPSTVEGLVSEILVKAGDVIKVGQAIFKLNAVEPQGLKVATSQETLSSPKASVGDLHQSPSGFPTKTFGNDNVTNPSTHTPVRANIPAAPSVRLLARELGIDLGLVSGSGPGGRISLADVKATCKMLNTIRVAGATAPVPKPLPAFEKWGQTRREAMNNVRKKTAEHLSFAWNSIPHVTQCEQADITDLEQLRKNASTDKRKLSVTSYIIKIIARGLKQFPQFNSSVDMSTHEIIYKDYVNIGVAVDTDRGLLVPVIKGVDTMTVAQISDELTAMAERARTRKTSLDELQGGCFTISNLGGIGGTFFTPIVNWPEVAILGVSRGVMEPVYGKDGQLSPRLMLPLSLSYDHRIIDGADGARFIRWVAQALEKPESLS